MQINSAAREGVFLFYLKGIIMDNLSYDRGITGKKFCPETGGASYRNISLGQKDHQRAKDILGNAFLFLMGIAVK